MRTRASGPQNVQRTAGNHSARAVGGLLALQAAAGNRAVSALVAGPALQSPRFVGDARLEACANNRSRLAVGDTGASVGKVQQALVDLGRPYDLGKSGAAHNGVDEIYGPRTAGAVRAFKTDEGLGSTQQGDVGPGTIRRLDGLFGIQGQGGTAGAPPTARPPASGTPAPGQQVPPSPTGQTTLGGSLKVDPANPALKPISGGFDFTGFSSSQGDLTGPSGRIRFGEYRQFIKGLIESVAFIGPDPAFKETKISIGDGRIVKKDSEQEDGTRTGHRYGHRNQDPGLPEYSNPNQATGSHFACTDEPGFTNIPAARVDRIFRVDLTFRAQLVDTCADQPGKPEVPIPGTEKNWTVKGTVSVPADKSKP
jgi:peptidoglycan hydrolase-like protein with peptidoglycan-binding domain